MPEQKACFLDKDRPCDLTCKAAFEVDDPVDNVDCYFIWLAHHFGEGLFEVRRVLEGMGHGSGGEGPGGPLGGSSGSSSGGPPGGPGPAPPRPKGHSDN